MSFFYGDTKTDELVVGQSSSSNGYIDLYDSGTTNKITLRAPNSITSSYNLTLPSAVGVEDQALILADGVGNINFSDQVKSSKRVVFTVKNNSAASLTPGTPVYIDGTTAGSSGRLTVRPTNASSSATMPAAGLIEGTITVGGNGILVEQGEVFNVDTSTYATNDTLYVDSTTGNLTINKPGYPNLIQNIGRVGRVNATEGFIIVTGPSRTNDVPNLGDSNIWIGKGTGFNTVECPVSGDVSLSNIGVITINGISNTATISSTANITMDTDQAIIFRNANTSIKSSADSNLSVKVDNTIFNHTGDVNYLTISSNADSSCVAVSFIGKSYNSNSTTPGVDEGKTGGILDILASSGSSNISGQYNYGSGGYININKNGYGLGGNNFNNNAAGAGSSIYLNGGQGGNSYLNTSFGAASSSAAIGGYGGSIYLYGGSGGTGYDGGDGGDISFAAGYGGSGSNSSGINGSIILGSNVKVNGTVKTSSNPNISFDSNISLLGTKKLYFNSKSYIDHNSSNLNIINNESSGSIIIKENTNNNTLSISSSKVSITASNITQSVSSVSSFNTMSGQIVYGVDTISSGGATDGTRVEIKSSTYYNSVKSIIQTVASNNNVHYFHANSGGQTGEIMNILYYNANASGSANIDFNTTNLYSGTGANRYLELSSTGQGATLIWINDSNSATISGWRIINTGGAVRGT